MTDAVEKVPGMPPARNKRIMGAEFLNRSCAFDARLESMLLGDPLKILFQQHRPIPDLGSRRTGVAIHGLFDHLVRPGKERRLSH